MKQVNAKTLPPEQFQAICQLYSIPPDELKLLKSNSNLIYGNDDKILKIIPSASQSSSDLATELDWIHFLKQKGISIADYIPSNNGLAQEQLTTENEQYSIACFHKLEGVRIEPENWQAPFFKQLGQFVGKLHRFAQEYQPKEGLIVKRWDELSKTNVLADLALEKDAYLIKKYDGLYQTIQAFPISPENYGMIHYDIHQGNYQLNQNREIALFDFELSCQSWYVNDIAVVLYYALQYPLKEKKTRRTFTRLFMKAFLEGYRLEKSIDPKVLTQLKFFLQLRNLVIHTYLKRIWKKSTRNKSQVKYQRHIRRLLDHDFIDVEEEVLAC